MADRIVVLNKGQIEQVGSPLELYANPANIFVAGFLGAPRMNFVQARVTDIREGSVKVALEGTSAFSFEGVDTTGLTVGDRTMVGIRPEHLRVIEQPAGEAATFGGEVRLVEHLGRETVLYVDASPLQTVNSDSGTGNFTVQLNKVSPVSIGASLRIGFAIGDAYLFGPDSRTLTPKKPVVST